MTNDVIVREVVELAEIGVQSDPIIPSLRLAGVVATVSENP